MKKNSSNRICLITTNHISTNPRLVKEAIALEKAGYHVHLIFTQANRFFVKLDEMILSEHPKWTYDTLNRTGNNISSFCLRAGLGLLQRIYILLARLTGRLNYINIALNKCYHWQLRKALQAKADLYIAHNVGALPVAGNAATNLKVKFGFDAEDFHRYEKFNEDRHADVIFKATLEDHYLPNVHHFTAASPLIAKEYQRLYSYLEPTVVLNVFPNEKTNKLRVQEGGTDRIRLFWFSQRIGENRGVEEIITAMSLCKKAKAELHLLGKYTPEYKKQIFATMARVGIHMSQVSFYEFVPENEIFQLASNFDIGMACETGVPYNREICLTNKIFTYIQSGLAVAASDTKAQLHLFDCYPGIGKTYKRACPQTLADILDSYHVDRDELQKCKQSNFLLGKKELNWEKEQEKFISCIREIWKGDTNKPVSTPSQKSTDFSF